MIVIGAIEAALRIINELKETAKIKVSIGVTTGKVFCGLVGSPYRHEYSVMGASVNLSARLMCAAPEGTVSCAMISFLIIS